MMEVAAAMVVLGLLAIMTAVVSRGGERAAKDTQATTALTALAAAQQLRYDTFGSYVEGQEDLADILSGYDFVAGILPSTGDTEVSVAVSTSGGEDVTAAAILASTDRCYMIRIHEPLSAVQDVRRVYADLPGSSCTGSYALGATGGDAW